jgi:hypothetical protein
VIVLKITAEKEQGEDFINYCDGGRRVVVNGCDAGTLFILF